MADDVHVYPLNDMMEHDTESRDCRCRPTIERTSGGWLVIHNSLDGREITERAVASIEQPAAAN